MLNIFPTEWPPRLHVTLRRPVPLLVDLLVATRQTTSVVLALRDVVTRFLAPLTVVMSVMGWGYWIRPHPIVNRRLAMRVRPFVVVPAADRVMLSIPRVVQNDFDPNSQPVVDRHPTPLAWWLNLILGWRPAASPFVG